MAEVITVSLEQMQETANTYVTQKGAQTVAYQAMKAAVESVDWTGEVAEKFRTQFREFFAHIEQSEAKMQDSVDELNKTHNLFTDANATTTSMIESLDVGTDPFA